MKGTDRTRKAKEAILGSGKGYPHVPKVPRLPPYEVKLKPRSPWKRMWRVIPYYRPSSTEIDDCPVFNTQVEANELAEELNREHGDEAIHIVERMEITGPMRGD